MKRGNERLRDNLLRSTNEGLSFFLKRHPELWLQVRFGQPVEIESPFTKKTYLSFFSNREKGKWFFKEHGEGEFYGDMFSYVARLYKLDYSSGFTKILTIIEAEMAHYRPPSFDTIKIGKYGDREFISFFR